MLELYYIQDTRQTVGNCAVWWKQGGHGYTCNLNEAWAVEFEKASGHRKTDVPRKVSDMLKLMELHVDVQKLRDPVEEP